VTHVGAGAVERNGTTHLVVLSAARRAALSPFPREVAAGARAVLSGELAPGLLHPRVFVTLPSGEVREVDAAGAGRSFRAGLAFPARGRYAVEVVGDGASGPEVAVLLAVAAGGAPLEAEGADRVVTPDPEDAAAAEGRVVDAINATRQARGLPPLRAVPELTDLARRHSGEMLSLGVLGHVLPGSGDLGARLRRARVPYRKAFENVAKGQGALAAHLTAEESPAHLENMVQPEATRVGVGIARGRLPGGAPIVYLTEIFLAPIDDGADSALSTDGRIREALWSERARRGRTPLTADGRLDALAEEAARAMRDRGEPGADGLGERALALGRKLSAVDAFVASAPAEAARSANVGDPRFHRVGVGVATGDSARFGAGRLFIAVVYTD
jgi:uncharacterized protein YkwD